MQAEYSHLLQLGRAERLQLVEDLWDSLAAEESQLPLPEWKVEELRRRKARYLENPKSGLNWEEVKRRARAQND